MARTNKLSKPEVIARINDLLANNNTKLSKYQRNYALYNQSPVADLRAKIPMPVGFQDDVYSDESVVPKLNVIKSAIDSVVSKISTAHCRPYVNTVKGSFKTIQICKQLQVFFDYYFDEQNVQNKVVQALRDACVFDTGYIYVDEVDGNISVIQPWNAYVRQTEKDDIKSCYVEFPNTSVDSLKDEDYEELNASERKGLYVNIGYFYDSRTKTKAVLVNRQIRNIASVESDTIPLVAIHYTMPIVGNSTLSVVDMLKGIQVEVDELMKRISDASVLNPGLTFFVSNASNIKVGQLNNRVGNIVQYQSPQNSAPVEVATPSFIADQYISLLDNLIEKAYNMVGISQLSAQGKKPVGLDSGVALATQNDIESDRFQVLLDQYIKMFTDLAKTVVKIFNVNKDIIEPSRYNLELTWGDVAKEYEKMRIQFSAADSLSKDPSEKLKQLQALAQAGIIPATQIASLLELPDINRGYSVANNAFNAAMTLIDQVIYDDKYEVPDYVPFQMLKEQIINMQLSLCAAAKSTENDDDIEKLKHYYELIEDREEELSMIQQQAVQQDMNSQNMYASQNNENLTGNTEQNLTTVPEGTANPYQTGVANQGETGRY